MFTTDPNVAETHYGMGVWRWDDVHLCNRFVGHDGAAPGYLTTAFSSLGGQHQHAVPANTLAPGDKVGDEAAHGAFSCLVEGAACP
jgi:hypothetical protein